MSLKNTTFGFGVAPELSTNHFYVIVPTTISETVKIYERFNWTESTEQVIEKADVLRLEISKHKWSKISAEITNEFNVRLKKDKIKVAKFLKGGTPVEKLFGKEMMVLLWAIEHCDPTVIPTALRNWKGLMPEERWWLYTMTNASTGKIKDKKGWRTALKYALCENPIDENPQIDFTQLIE